MSKQLTFIHRIANELSEYQADHQWKTKRQIAGGLDENNGQTYGHPHNATQAGSGTEQGILGHPLIDLVRAAQEAGRDVEGEQPNDSTDYAAD